MNRLFNYSYENSNSWFCTKIYTIYSPGIGVLDFDLLLNDPKEAWVVLR